MKLEPHQIILSHIITEESQIQLRKANQYTFRVPPAANKVQIRDAVESLWKGVKVVSVNTINCEGKTRRSQTTRRVGRKSDWKKAIVTLRQGDKIDLI
jgi:large subunit ribosomal protein L23